VVQSRKAVCGWAWAPRPDGSPQETIRLR